MTNGSVHHDKSDPIFNFLFEYYHFKPRMLLQWTPGFDTYLLDADPSLKGTHVGTVLHVGRPWW